MDWVRWGTIIQPTTHGPSNDGPITVQIKNPMSIVFLERFRKREKIKNPMVFFFCFCFCVCVCFWQIIVNLYVVRPIFTLPICCLKLNSLTISDYLR